MEYVTMLYDLIPTLDKCANLPVCSMACRHGFKKNEDGCSICQCKDAPGKN